MASFLGCRWGVECLEVVLHESGYPIDNGIDLSVGNIVGRGDNNVVTVRAEYSSHAGVDMNLVRGSETFQILVYVKLEGWVTYLSGTIPN